MAEDWLPPMTPAQFAGFSAHPLETHPDRKCQACDGMGYLGPWGDGREKLIWVLQCRTCNGTGHRTDWPKVSDALAMLGLVAAFTVLAAFWVMTP